MCVRVFEKVEQDLFTYTEYCLTYNLGLRQTITTCLGAAWSDRGGLLGVAGCDGGEAVAMIQKLSVGEAIAYTQHRSPDH